MSEGAQKQDADATAGRMRTAARLLAMGALRSVAAPADEAPPAAAETAVTEDTQALQAALGAA